MAERKRDAYWAETLGALVLIGGLAFLLWQFMISGNLTTIPLNTNTYVGMGIAASGAVLFVVGADRGYK